MYSLNNKEVKNRFLIFYVNVLIDIRPYNVKFYRQNNMILKRVPMHFYCNLKIFRKM